MTAWLFSYNHQGITAGKANFRAFVKRGARLRGIGFTASQNHHQADQLFSFNTAAPGLVGHERRLQFGEVS